MRMGFSERGVGMYNLYHCLKITCRRDRHIHHGVAAIIDLYEFCMVVCAMELQLHKLSHIGKQLLCTEFWRILTCFEAFEGCGFSQLRKTYWK
jgi:hypothetical protein